MMATAHIMLTSRKQSEITESSRTQGTNLQSFLAAVTPKVTSESLAKSWCRDFSSLLQPFQEDKIDFFFLGELWERYREWSAYGVGVDVRLNSRDVVTQYYVPYLSAIQIYTNKDYSGHRNVVGRSGNNGHTTENDKKKVLEVPSVVNLGSTNKKQRGYLYLDYSDSMSPYTRLPLLSKILELAKTYPGLQSFKSTDLSPDSWLSVAWYPICHIPPKGTIKELFTCFLTYHTLSSVTQDCSQEGMTSCLSCIKAVKNGKTSYISLPPFGIATYKLQGTLWIMPNSGDHGRLQSLFHAAALWLNHVSVYHHDFSFFANRSAIHKATF